MSKILGLDLGTNSIGWAVRDTELNPGATQITNKGVMVFEKGVGEKKGEEFSLASERTRARSSRKKNLRRRWRKIELLSSLINQKMCPLTLDELNIWSRPKRKSERKYPESELFKNWLRLDFNNDGTEDYKNPFELRTLAIQKQLNSFEIGRIFYHLIQRRGYLSNRSEKAKESEDLQDLDIEDSENQPKKKLGKVATAIKDLEEQLNGKTIGQLLYEEIENGGRARRRTDESTNIYRLTLQDEFLKICEFQKIDKAFAEKLRKIIFEQRPLKSQKGTIGKCIYEQKKARCPISHPEFELYRMWQVVNNIKYSDDNKKSWQSLNSEERKIVQEKFFRKSSPSFPFSDIKKVFAKSHPNRLFNYKDYQTISGCPTLSGLINVLGAEKVWELRKLAIDRISWEEHEKKQNKGEYENKRIDLFDIWHWLFLMDNDKDEQIVKNKAISTFNLTEKEAKSFIKTPIKQGYGSLSLKAIRKINKWLEKGEKYDKAVFLANIPYMFERKLWIDNEEGIIEAIQNEIEQIGFKKNITDITNSLIKKYNNLPYTQRFANDKGYQLDDDDRKDIKESIENYFGSKKWIELTELDRIKYENEVSSQYEKVLSKGNNGDISFIKPPRLEDNIRKKLAEILSLDTQDKVLDKLYHPSEIESFLPSIEDKDTYGNKTGRKLLNIPRTDSIRNPMAMRSLYELRKLLNYLLKEDIIDEHTHVIVEMAKELNDANRRKAIERYQREREAENASYEKEVKKIFEEQGRRLPEDLAVYIERYRLREEQPKRVCMYTGICIKDTDLVDEFTTDIEHTLPRSLTFDDSLQNKTIAYKQYNNEIKNKLLPSELPNYKETALGYDPIEPRLENWKTKVTELSNKIEICKKRSKAASTKEAKDKAIQDRHYYQMHYVYWKSKLERFTITEVTEKFKNSQLTDTQLISKYGVLYLKTLFYRVRATKGILTDKIKKIWGAMSADEKKDRSQHTHHTIDAIIQTLLHKERNKPDIYNLLAESYKEAESNRWKEPKLPNPWGLAPDAFYTSMQQLINDVIVFHADRDNVLKQTKRKERLKGKIVYHIDENGNKKPKYQTGRGIRASLHKDTFYGAIKLPVKENGKLKTDENGKLILQKDDKGNDLIKYRTSFVFRGNTVDAIKKSIENIVDDRLRELAKQVGAALIHKQGYFEIPPSEERLKKNPAAQATKVFKVKVFASISNPLQIKEHISSNKEHKKWYYVDNEENSYLAVYASNTGVKYACNAIALSAFMISNKIIGNSPIKKRSLFPQQNKNLPLVTVLKKGSIVIFYEKHPDEINWNNPFELNKRLYKVEKIEKGGRATFKKITDSRDDKSLKADYEATYGKDYDKTLFTGKSKFELTASPIKLNISPANLTIYPIDNVFATMHPNGRIEKLKNLF